MAFADDVDTDRSVFLNTAEFGTSATYRVASSGATSTITVVAEEQIFAITDDKANKKFHVSAGDVANPVRGDQITDANGDRWDVLDIQQLDSMWELRCFRAQVIA